MFADRFDPADRDYPVTDDSPRWHREVREALADLRAQGLVDADGAPTPAGVARAAAAQAAARRATPAGTAAAEPAEEPLLVPGVIAAPLRSRRARRKIGFADDEDRPIPVMAEINLRFGGGRAAAFDRLDDLWGRVAGGRRPRRVAGQYAAGDLSMRQVERLVAADAVPVAWRGRSVYRIWPDFPVRLHVDASCVTVKADAARRSFNAYGDDIVWAVVDTGIAKDHPHFAAYHTLDHPDVDDLHRDFTGDGEPTPDGAFVDEVGHGTHVAGIIAGAIGPWLAEKPQQRAVRATENRHNPANPQQPLRMPRPVDEPDAARRHRAAGEAGEPQGGQRGRDRRRPGQPGDRSAGLRPRGQRRGHGRDAHPRRQPQRRLRVRPRVVRLRAQPAVRGGRQAGPVGRRRRGGGGQLRLRHARGARHGRAHQVRPGHDDQRPRQRRAGDHRRLDAPRRAAHLRRVVLLVQGPDRRRPVQAGPRRARRAHHVVRGRAAPRRGPGRAARRPTPPSTSRTAARAWPRRTCPARSRRCCRCGASSSAAPRR